MGTEVFDRIRKGKTPINVPLTSISTAYFQGKSGHSDVAGSTTIAKARAIADEIKKSNPNMSDTEAMAKTWETHPKLMKDYDDEIGG